jgi:hypothetical protein
MPRIRIVLALTALLMLGGCAMDSSVSPEHAEGSLPWNRPQSWEGAGPLGGAMQGTP